MDFGEGCNGKGSIGGGSGIALAALVIWGSSNFLTEARNGSEWLEEYKHFPERQNPIPASWNGVLAEEVGFEPTDTCASLDFESSALNQAQPSLREAEASKGWGRVKKCGQEKTRRLPFQVHFGF